MLDLTKLTTETRNDKTMNLDQMTPAELAAVMNEEDGNVVKAVKEVIPEIATAIEWATESLIAAEESFTWEQEPAAGWEFWMPLSVRPPLECLPIW